MFPLDYVLAVAVIATAPDYSEVSATAEIEEPADAWEAFATVRPVVQAVAVDWELLDQRETRYVMNRAEDFAGDLKLLRRRYGELYNAPASYECMRFPDRGLINDLLKFNRDYRQYLEIRQATEPLYWWEFHTVMMECDRIYEVWDLVRESNCDYYYVTVRRQALKKLRERIGDGSFYSGVLPPHVPVWRFARVD
jgi:hypothetical protein